LRCLKKLASCDAAHSVLLQRNWATTVTGVCMMSIAEIVFRTRHARQDDYSHLLCWNLKCFCFVSVLRLCSSQTLLAAWGWWNDLIMSLCFELLAFVISILTNYWIIVAWHTKCPQPVLTFCKWSSRTSPAAHDRIYRDQRDDPSSRWPYLIHRQHLANV